MKKRTLSLLLALVLAFSLCVPAIAVDGTYFTDVEPDAWYYDAVRWAADAGVVEGYPDGSFGVNRICTEQEAITMLWRAAGRVETGTGTKDSEKAMAWLERQSGEDLDFYRAGAPVTRADYVMILYTALGDLVDLPAELPFTDLEGIVDDEEDAAFYDASMRWAYAKGLIKGVTDTKFCPLQEMPREQIVTLLQRCFEKELPYTVTEQEIPFYVESKENLFSLTLNFVDGQTDIPYLSVQEMSDLLMAAYALAGYPRTVTLKTDGDRVTLTRENGFPMILDFDTDTISFLDYDAFMRLVSDGPILDIILETGYDAEGRPAFFEILDSSSERYGIALTMDLGAYGLRLIRQGDNYYIPLQTVNDVLFNIYGMGILYNGQIAVLAPGGELADMYYDVPAGDRSAALALFTYKELCFALDFFYGLKDQHNISSFLEEFKMDGLKPDLLSTDPAVADAAIDRLTRFFLDDLHSGFTAPSYLTGPEVTWDTPSGASRTVMFDALERLIAARGAAFPEGVPGYQEVGDTAYITFDSFVYERNDYYQTPPDETTTDTMGLMIYAYSQITRKGSPVKNVVMDLSINGGGTATSAAYVIGTFLGQGSISLRNTMTNALVTQNFLVDLNLDRVFDEKDSLLDYNLFCLTSAFSFSCGNLVPSVFKSSHKVTMLGQTSGGGSCAVMAMTTASGTRFQISGPYCLSYLKNGSFYDIDQGSVPDHVINDYAKFYDREALTEYIHGLY